jgi:hypothetical protein
MPKPTDSAGGEPTGTAPVTPAVYNEFIAGLDLEGIRLVHAHIDATGLPERRSLRPQLRIDEASYANSEDQVKVLHHLDFSGFYEGSEGPAVNVHARFEVTYSAKERMSDEIFDEFKARNLPINTWPYFREFVHTALARVGWPVLVLPVYKKTNPFFSGAEPEAESSEQEKPV